MRSIKFLTNKFISDLTIKSKSPSEEDVKRIYYGLVKLIAQELKEKGEIFLPEIGDITIRFDKNKRMIDVNTKEIIVIDDIPVIKFTPWKALKLYLKQFFVTKRL